MDELLKRHAPLVRRLAHQMLARLPASIELDDLIQVGMIGLHEALGRFDSNKGVQFETFATPRIRGAMLDELRAHDWLSVAARRNQRRIDTVQRNLCQRFGRSPTEGELAREMGISLADYQRLMGAVCGVQMVYLEDLPGVDAGEDFLAHYLPGASACPSETIEQAQTIATLRRAFDRLPQAVQATLTARFDHGETYAEMAAKRRITESGAFLQVQAALHRLGVQLGGASKPPVAPAPVQERKTEPCELRAKVLRELDALGTTRFG